SAFGMSIDEFQEAYVSPQVLFNNVMPLSYASSDGLVGKSVTLSTLNHDLGINDPGFTAPQLRWSIADLPPAWNTLTLTKLSLLSRAGLIALMEDLGVECPNGACLTDENVALGFMRSLDESLQWLPDDPTRPLDDPAYALYKDALPGFAFEQCAVYAQLFMQQHGDESDAYVADG